MLNNFRFNFKIIGNITFNSSISVNMCIAIVFWKKCMQVWKHNPLLCDDVWMLKKKMIAWGPLIHMKWGRSCSSFLHYMAYLHVSIHVWFTTNALTNIQRRFNSPGSVKVFYLHKKSVCVTFLEQSGVASSDIIRMYKCASCVFV